MSIVGRARESRRLVPTPFFTLVPHRDRFMVWPYPQPQSSFLMGGCWQCFSPFSSASSEFVWRHTLALLPSLLSMPQSTLPMPLLMLEHPLMHSMTPYTLHYLLPLAVTWPSFWVILMQGLVQDLVNGVWALVHMAPASWKRMVNNFLTSVLAMF